MIPDPPFAFPIGFVIGHILAGIVTAWRGER